MAIFSEDYVNKIKENNNLNIIKEDSLFKNINEPYCITVDIGRGQEVGFLGNPYMKFYNDSNPNKYSARVVRINLITGEKIIHKGHLLFKTNKSDINWLINTLTKRKSTNKKYSNMIVYDAIWAFIYDTARDYNIKCATKPDINEFIKFLK